MDKFTSRPPGEEGKELSELHERWEEQDVKESAGNTTTTTTATATIDVRRRGARRRRRRRRRRSTRRRRTTTTRRRPGEEREELSELHERWDVAAAPQVWTPRGDDIATYEREQRQRARQDTTGHGASGREAGRERARGGGIGIESSSRSMGHGAINCSTLHGSAEVRGALLRCVI